MRWLIALLCAGCYSPDPQPGAPCNNNRCPHPLVCSLATNTCEKDAVFVDARVIDAPPIDARGDAMPDAVTTPMVVQQATNFALNATALSVTLPALPKNGNVLVMVGAHISGGLTSVSGGGATWTLAARSLINRNVEIWVGTSNGTSATVTIERPTEINQIWLAVSEWSGITSTLDGARADNGSTTTVSAGSITTTNANDLLIFAATAPPPNTYGAPSPGTWTQLTPISNNDVTQFAWYRVVSSAGAQAPSVTQTALEWDAAVAALRLP